MGSLLNEMIEIVLVACLAASADIGDRQHVDVPPRRLARQVSDRHRAPC